jgi:hypothetical protein
MEHVVERVVVEKEEERIVKVSICKALMDILMMGMINICEELYNGGSQGSKGLVTQTILSRMRILELGIFIRSLKFY